MRRWSWLLLLAVLLSGCHMQKGKSENLGRPVVQQIVVTGQQGIKIFTSEEKMQEILLKIRRLGQKFTPQEDPDSLPGDRLLVEIIRSDDTRERYTIQGDRFIQRGDQPWQQTESRPLQALIDKLDALVPDG